MLHSRPFEQSKVGSEMFARFKMSLIAAVFTATITVGLVGCGSTQPTVKQLNGYRPATVVIASKAPLDEFPDAQALIADAVGIHQEVMLGAPSAIKTDKVVEALCGVFAADPQSVNATTDELQSAASRVFSAYSGKVKKESTRVGDSIRDLDERVTEACPAAANDAGWFK